MTQKKKLALERKARRKPPIPYTRKTPTKQELLQKAEKRIKQCLCKLGDL